MSGSLRGDEWMRRWQRWFLVFFGFLGIGIFGGCGQKEVVHTDGYEYVIGISLTNIVEPWLNNLVQVITDKANDGRDVRLIFRDGAGNAEKQINDIEALMECGIDLLILSPNDSDALNDTMEKVFEKIPIVVLGVEPDTQAYTTVIQADDEGIGRLAGEYILDNLYEPGKNVVVIEGVKDSPISSKRLSGFQKAIEGQIPDGQITYYYGEWLRDTAELRMKDFLVVNDTADIIFAFNDDMAYGAYQACQQLRIQNSVALLGVDGFEGEAAGLNLVERGILDATIQSPDFGALAYDTALDILEGNEVERYITVVPEVITGK